MDYTTKPNTNYKLRKQLFPLKIILRCSSIINNLIYKPKFKGLDEVRKLGWPILIFSSHASMCDFYWTFGVSHKGLTCYITSIEEFVARDFLMRGISCISKRKYTKDLSVIKRSLYAIKNLGLTLTVFPEARFDPCGINERIDKSLGKFAKMAKVPVVVEINHGNFLWKPHWGQDHARDAHFEPEFKVICTKEEVNTLSADEIQRRIEEAFVFDDYKWLRESNYTMDSKYRADHIHNILYKCPHCNKDYSMDSSLTKLWCKECGATYEMDNKGVLHGLNCETKFSHVPDWYLWERDEVRKEIESGSYHFESDVYLEHLGPWNKGFIPMGTVHFTHDYEGLHLHGTIEDGTEFNFDNDPINTPSLHIEYNFNKKGIKYIGQAADINTIDDTWFILFNKNPEVKVLTKLHFAVELMYDKVCKDRGVEKSTT